MDIKFNEQSRQITVVLPSIILFDWVLNCKINVFPAPCSLVVNISLCDKATLFFPSSTSSGLRNSYTSGFDDLLAGLQIIWLSLRVESWATNLTGQMRCFSYPLDLIHTFIWERAHGKCLDRWWPLKKNLVGCWINSLSIIFNVWIDSAVELILYITLKHKINNIQENAVWRLPSSV